MINNKAQSIPLIVSSVGLAETDEKLLSAAIEHAKTQGINCRYLGSERTEGHLVVIDSETESGSSALKSLRPGQVKLIFTSDKDQINGKNTVAISKPLKEAVVNALFLRLANKLDALLRQKKETKAGAGQEPQAESKTESANPEETVFHILMEAKKNLRALSINAYDVPPLLVNGIGNKTATEMDADALRNVLAMPATNVEIRDIEVSDVPTASNGNVTVASLDAALWTAGIMWRPSPLIGDVTLDTPVRLKAWPNFTRNNFFSEHLKLSAALAVNAVTLQRLHEMTKIPLEEVTCFYNAANAVGLIEIEKEEAPAHGETNSAKQTSPPSTTPRKDTKRQGLLAKLADRLGFG